MFRYSFYTITKRTFLKRIWRTHKYLIFGALLLLLTIIMTVTYYVNSPRVEFNADTPAYAVVAERIYVHPYALVDVWRLPGYPFFISLIYIFAGYHCCPIYCSSPCAAAPSDASCSMRSLPWPVFTVWWEVTLVSTHW